MADGTIKISTEIDDTGLKKGLDNVKKQGRKTYAELAKESGKSVKQVKADVDKMAQKYHKEGMSIQSAYKRVYKEMNLASKSYSKNSSDDAKKVADSYKKSFSKIKHTGITAFKAIGTSVAAAATTIGGMALAAGKVGIQFEAQMSKVEAISGATGEQLELLTAKAKEMGATTKFSASQSAEALEYMALAGWKTEDMLNGISGVMNLAAASGEDLAMVSDILTDGLSAFGLAASDSSRFADVLAAASSNANTNVAMLGESFKYTAPIAGALGYSIEDTAVALGLMANSGIKASNSGTALRAILNGLSGSSSTATKALNELGINTVDASGKMIPLNDVMIQLRSAFGGLSEAQQAQYAKSIAGAEAMSGLLAIVNASEADFNKLTNAINNSNGAAENMAAIMQDNLKGQIDLLKSGLEGLGISLYDNLQTPLKEVTKYAAEMVQNLNQALDEGGIDGFVVALGENLAKGITDLANNTPIMIDVAIQLIQSLIDGIQQNANEIGKGSAQIITLLIDGIIQGTPNLIKASVDVLKSFTIGLIENLPILIPATVEMVYSLTEGLINRIDELVDVAIELITALANGLIEALPLLISKAPVIINKLVEAIVQNLPLIAKSSIEIIKTIVKALIENLPLLIKTGIDINKAVAKGIISAMGSIIDVGKEIIRGIWSGITSMGSWFKDKLKGWADGVVTNVKKFFDIHSPSRRMRDEVGVMLSRGTAIGISKEENKVVKALVSPFHKASNELKPSNNPFSKNVVNIIKDAKTQAEKEGKTFGDVGKAITTSISDTLKSDKNTLIDTTSNQLDELLKANIKKVEDNGKNLINTYKKQIENDKSITKEAGRELIKTYTDSVKQSVNEDKEKLKTASTELMDIFKNSIETGANQINDLVNNKISKITNDYQSKLNEVVNAQESLQNKLAGGDLFGFTKDEDDTVKVVIEDLDKTINKLTEYDKAITSLKNKGASDAILGELSKYSTDEALQVANKLLSMTDTEFEKLNQKWIEKQETAKRVAANFYKDQIDTLEKNFNQELTKSLEKLPNEIEDIGVMVINGFETGVNSKMDSILSQVSSFADEIVSTMQRALDIHSPSRRMRWIGEMTGAGLETGIINSKDDVLNAAKESFNIVDVIKNQLPTITGVVNSAMSGLTPKSSNISNVSNVTNNTTNNGGDFIVKIDKVQNTGNGSIKGLLEEAEFYRQQQSFAIGGV